MSVFNTLYIALVEIEGDCQEGDGEAERRRFWFIQWNFD